MNMTMKKTIYALAVAIAYATAVNAQEPLPAEWHLDECIKYAQEHSIEVQQSKLQYETSRSTLRVNQLSMTPSVSASVGQTFSFGRATGRDNVIINQSQASTSFGANASMPIFTGLRITNQIKSSKLNLQAALADIENAEDNVALNIAAQYLQVLYNQELVKISREQYEQSKELVEKTSVLVEQGKTSESELYENRAQMMQYAQTLTESENSLSLSVVDLCQAELALNVRLGKVPDHILPVVFGPAGDEFDQAANIVNIIFLLFRHGCVHSFQRSGSATH